MNPDTISSDTGRPSTYKKLIPIILSAVLAAAGLWFVVASFMAQPQNKDFSSLNVQRKVMKTTLEVYSPLLTEYSRVYLNAYAEDRSAEEIESIQRRFGARLAHRIHRRAHEQVVLDAGDVRGRLEREEQA